MLGEGEQTLMVRSLLAQLLMMDRDCWKRVPPIPMTSAISWLTAITTWGRRHRVTGPQGQGSLVNNSGQFGQ